MVARLNDTTVALFYGGSFDAVKNEVVRPGRWPHCIQCGKERADLYWHASFFLQGPDKPATEVIAMCFGCVDHSCRGLVLDLILEGYKTEQETISDIQMRVARVTSLRRKPREVTDDPADR